MKRLLCTLIPLSLLPLAPAQESIMVSHAEPLRFAFAVELLGFQLDAVELGGELGGELDDEEDAADAAEADVEAAEPDDEDEDEVRVRPVDLFAGSLAERDPALHHELVASLEEIEQASEREDQAATAAAVERVRPLLRRAEEVLLPEDLRDDPAFRAAVLARLALSGSGFAEGYEEAAGGEVGAYIFGWAGLQRAKALWAELEPAATNRDSVAEVDRAFAVLDDLMPSPEPPERFRDPEDAEVAAHDLVFALEAAFGGQLQPRNLGAVLALVDDQSRAACVAFEEERELLALELVTSAQVNYVEGIGGTISLLVPEPAGVIRELLGESLPEQMRAGERAEVSSGCARLQEAIAEASSAFR
ncbi:MAG: hypothetical protein WD314_06585 [Trueperaceae bacterium]